jgi:hypothetical protein
VPESVELDTPPIDRARLAADLGRVLRHFAPAEIVAEADFPGLIAHTEAFYREIHGHLEGLDAEAADFAGIFAAIRGTLRRPPEAYGRVSAMCDGTLYALTRIGMFYGYRVADAALRRRIFQSYLREFRAILAEMERRTIDLFRHLEQCAKQAESLAIA